MHQTSPIPQQSAAASAACALICALSSPVIAATSSVATPAAASAPAAALPAASAATRPRAAQATAATAAAPTRLRVALDVGHRPGEGGRSASGLPEHNFNLRFAAALERQLRQQGLDVRRLPTGLSLADRARRAEHAALLLSVHHDARSARPKGNTQGESGLQNVRLASSVDGSGYALTIGSGGPRALRCAQGIGQRLQASGRHFSDHASAGKLTWADARLGVRSVAGNPLLNAGTPAVQLDVADISRPSEERLARDVRWVRQQAQAVARGVRECLKVASR